LIFGEAVLRNRAKIVFDEEIAESLSYLQQNDDKYLNVEMLISPPGLTRGNANKMYFFVNGRWVKDKLLKSAVFRGYHTHILSGRYPYILCFIKVNPSLLDVNVHPAKTEVRFQYAKEVQDIVATSIRKSLRSAEWADTPSLTRDVNTGSYVIPQRVGRSFGSTVTEPLVTKSSYDGAFGGRDNHLRPSRPAAVAEFRASSEPQVMQTSFFDEFALSGPANNASPTTDSPKINWDSLNYLGTFAKCYLLFEDRSSLLAVDQHAFHERILFEKLSNTPSLLSTTQTLLVPEAVTFSASEYSVFAENKEKFAALGFDYELLSNNTVEVTKVPALLIKCEIESLLTDLIASSDFSAISGVDLAADVLSTLACHAAVKAGEELSFQEIKMLLSEAKSVDFYHNCPHGRKVLKWWDLNDVEGWFDR
jgi:DNA mismatch repair protein MutL